MTDLIKAVPDVFSCKPKSNFSLSKHLNRFESCEDARVRKNSLINALKRYRLDEEDLIQRLENCCKEDRCRLLCCPVCMRVLRLWFCDQIAPLVAAAPEMFKSITLVPDRHRHDVGTLHTFKAQHLIDDFRTALKKHGLKNVIVFGSIDYCEEIIRDEKGQYDRVWCPHLHLISNISDAEWTRLNVDLGRYFPRTSNVKVPIKVVRLVSSDVEVLKPMSYCVKMNFYSKYSAVASKSLDDSASVSRTSAPTKRKKQRMHGKFQAELACIHARQRFKDRILLIGLKHVQKSIVLTGNFGVDL
jgi:hypothetical protein